MKLSKTILPHVILTLLLLSILVLTQLPSIEKMLHRWNEGDNDYCFLIIPLFIYLCWDRRFNGKTGFRFDVFEWSWMGFVVLGAAAGFMVLGAVGAVESILYGGLYVALVGIVVLLYGYRARLLAFPLLILAFMVPLPPFINRTLTFNLKMAATTLSVKMLRLFEISVLQTGNIIDLGGDKLQVVDACSGLRYFVPLILMALLVGYFFNKGLWRRLLLLAIVPPLSIVVNAFRIFVSGWLTVNGYRELAQSFFHDFSGWAVFMLAGAILVGISYLLRKIGRSRPQPSIQDRGAYPGNGRFKPLALTAIVGLLFVLSGFTMRNVPTAANLPERARLEQFPMEIAQWRGTQQFLSQEIMKELWADDYVSALYRNPATANTIQLLIPFYAVQGAQNAAHAPQSCLLGSGFDLLRSKDRTVPVNGGGSLTVRTLLMKQGDTKILSSYFFFMRGRVITDPWVNKFYMMVDAFRDRRTDGALVRAELHMTPGQSEEEAFEVLSGFLKEVWGLLPEYVPV